MTAVLIIEDDKANREVFTKILARAGFKVESAENGLEALRLLGNTSYDVIVCDIAMPMLSGIGFFEQIEKTYPQMVSRTMFVTAYADDPSMKGFLKRTGQPVMEKPVAMAALVEAVRKMAG